MAEKHFSTSFYFQSRCKSCKKPWMKHRWWMNTVLGCICFQGQWNKDLLYKCLRYLQGRQYSFMWILTNFDLLWWIEWCFQYDTNTNMNILTFTLNVTWLVLVLWYYIASAKLLLYNAHRQGEKKQETDIFSHFEIMKIVIKPSG